MICARCERPLLRVAVMIGKHAVGPVCAKRMGLTKTRTRKTESCRQAVDDPRQLDWINSPGFEGIGCAG